MKTKKREREVVMVDTRQKKKQTKAGTIVVVALLGSKTMKEQKQIKL